MNRAIRTLSTAGICLFGSVALANANLLTNPGFETGDFSGWSLSGNTGFVSITSDAHSGNFGASFGAVGSETFLSQTVADTAGSVLDIGGFLKNLGGPINEFQIIFDGATLLTLANQAPFPYTLESVSAIATGLDTITFAFQQNPSFWHFDDAFATPTAAVPEPGSLSIIASGLLGLAFLRRRRQKG